MLTGELRNQIHRIWDAFRSGGISNPLEVIEQITYLLFRRGHPHSRHAVRVRFGRGRALTHGFGGH
jgi:HsdM N-terminal domain